jgi:hypothetical protein
MSDAYRIGHFFADYGVESEALAAFGTVHRYTIDPEPNPAVDETVTVDLMAETPDADLDLAVLHPKCTRWSDMPNVDPDEHENQIPRARRLGQTLADDYILENKPRAPLEDPVLLHGRMFGLPLAYERAFETSFAVPQPPRQQTFGGKTVSPYFLADRTTAWWQTTKGYTGDYPKQHLAKNALPAAYVRFLGRAWLESLETRDAEVPQDNNDPAPREHPPDQAALSEVSGE